ncbi:MAG: hypothetical protein KDB65_12135 [Calditrichaeota bacterium]|nr:hypothetical protein [Calditrichota bacterium]MCB9367562.1 hypothetical protein [Calditrichota bacterium]
MKKTIEETALEQALALLKMGGIPVLFPNFHYLCDGEDVTDIISRRELEALLIRTGLFTVKDHLTKEQARLLTGNLIGLGIHLDEWLTARNFQSELANLKKLLNDGTLFDNDTRLRLFVLELFKFHHSDLIATHTKKPADTSIHVNKILNNKANIIALINQKQRELNAALQNKQQHSST